MLAVRTPRVSNTRNFTRGSKQTKKAAACVGLHRASHLAGWLRRGADSRCSGHALPGGRRD
eukprot:315466-Rhodomonas_salina.1